MSLLVKKVMSLLVKKYVQSGGLVLLFILSLGLITYGGWLYQVETGNHALRNGDRQSAAEIFRAAEAPFRTVPWLGRVLKDDYRKLVFNQIGVLYSVGRYDEVADILREAAEIAPFLRDTGEYAFWTGNLLLRQAAASKKPQVIIKKFRDALAVYRKGLEIEPGDWDLKYNFELVHRALSKKEKGKKKKTKVRSILEKMRPRKTRKKELPLEQRG